MTLIVSVKPNYVNIIENNDIKVNVLHCVKKI